MVDVIFRDVDPAMLSQIAALLAPVQPEVLEPAWDADTAEVLLRDLHKSALGLLRLMAQHHGRVTSDVVRKDPEQSLRGLTGPITKAMQRLVKAGRLPEGLPHPVATEYDPNIRAYQKAIAFSMPAAMVPAFAAAFERIEANP